MRPAKGRCSGLAASMPNVLLIVPTSYEWSRQIVRGVTSYIHERAPGWQLIFLPGHDPSRMDRFSQIDVAIVHASGRSIDVLSGRLACPVVLVEQSAVRGWPVVRSDNTAIGRLAHEHLAANGFRRFAFYGPAAHDFVFEREHAFADATANAGHIFHAQPGSPYWRGPRVNRPFALDLWLQSLPRPIAVFAASDHDAAAVLRACRTLHLRVPEEVAILGVNNEALLCDAVVPTLSSIDQNGYRVGFEAADRVACLLAGRDPGPGIQLVRPRGVEARESTAAASLASPRVAEACRWIRQLPVDQLDADRVSRRVGVARRTLDLDFQRHLGRTVHAEIARWRIRQACLLLADPRLDIWSVAVRCGFSSASYFTKAFRRQTGTTPAAYRRSRHAAAQTR